MIENQFEKVETATSVEMALQKIQENIFSCILLDIHLKDRNGAEVLKFLKDNPENKNHNCPVVILSGIINAQFVDKNKNRFAGIIIKPFNNDSLIEMIQNILSGKKEKDYNDIPSPNCQLPFPIPQLQDKVNKVMDQVKKNNKVKQLFSELKIDRNTDAFLMAHIGMLINVATGISNKLEWNTDKTLEKFVYAAYLHDMAIAEKPELLRIQATTIELELMKDKMDSRDYKLLFDHATLAANKIDEIIEVPQDVGIMVRQHHELPRGNGYPLRLPFGKITPLSTVFIVAHDLVDYIWANPNWTVKGYCASVKTKFKGPHFAKVLYALSELS